jgi:hypothetical protein
MSQLYAEQTVWPARMNSSEQCPQQNKLCGP